jgi:hypothetical protein
MAYSYKTKELLDSNVNFAAIYDEKQDKVKEMTGFDFNLDDIVRFLKSETDNFQNPIELAKEIDTAIFNIYTNWMKEKGKKQTEPASTPKPAPSAPSEPTPSDNANVKKLKAEIDDIQFLLDISSDQAEIDKYTQEIADVQFLIDLES